MTKMFELSEETAALVRCLQPMPKTTQIAYDELSSLVGFKVTPASGKLFYARWLLEKNHNAIWICVKPKIGLRRLTDAEIAERLPTWWMNGARSKLSHGGSQADIVELNELDVNQQARFAVDSIQAELARESLSKATRRKMEKVARGTSNDMPAFTAIEWAISLSRKQK